MDTNRESLKPAMTETELASLVRSVVAQTLAELPTDRVAYTIDDAAAAIGIPRNTLRDCVSSGELPAVKRCNRWLIRRDDLLRWLSDRHR